jgi:hypothetical protein
MNQVFEGHMAGQPLVNAARDVADLGKLFQEDTLAFSIGLHQLIGFSGMFDHEGSLLSLNSDGRWS